MTFLRHCIFSRYIFSKTRLCLRERKSAEYLLRAKQLAWLQKNFISTDGLVLADDDEALNKIGEYYQYHHTRIMEQRHNLALPDGVEPIKTQPEIDTQHSTGLVYVDPSDPHAVLAEYLRCNPAIASNKAKASKLQVTYTPRPPIVSVMGHVDHGKTTLLDALRNASVAESEVGGITQSIGAFEVMLGTATATFIDTPGHAAFAQMRTAAAMATDVVVLVVASTDYLQPQSREVLDLARERQVPVVVALSKVDLAPPDMDRLYNELEEEGFIAEARGGDVQVVPVVAPRRQGLEELVEAVSLAAELCDPPVTAPTPSRAEGVLLEAESGHSGLHIVTLRGGFARNMPVVVGQGAYIIQRVLNWLGEEIQESRPSQPVTLRVAPVVKAGSGVRGAPIPSGGSPIVQVPSVQEAKKVQEALVRTGLSTTGATGAASAALQRFQRRVQKLTRADVPPTVELLDRLGQVPSADDDPTCTTHTTPGGRAAGRKVVERVFLNVVIVADTQGSLSAVLGVVEELPVCEVVMRVVHCDVVGRSIPSRIVRVAQSCGAAIIAFRCLPEEEVAPNPRPPPFWSEFQESRVKALVLVRSHAPPGTFDRVYRCDQTKYVFPMLMGEEMPAYEPFETNVPLFHFEVLYDLEIFCRGILELQLPLATKLVETGIAHVAQVFPISFSPQEKALMREGRLKKFRVAGCIVKSGVIMKNASRVDIFRMNKLLQIASGVYSLKHFKAEVDEINEGNECGVAIEGYFPEPGDQLHFFKLSFQPRTLEDSLKMIEEAEQTQG